MFKAVLLQASATLVAILLAGLLAGEHGAVSAALGGAAIFLPNLLFALRLAAVSRLKGAAHPATFLIGELVKVALTLALLIAASQLYSGLHWLSLLAGLFLALQSNLFALLMKT